MPQSCHTCMVVNTVCCRPWPGRQRLWCLSSVVPAVGTWCTMECLVRHPPVPTPCHHPLHATHPVPHPPHTPFAHPLHPHAGASVTFTFTLATSKAPRADFYVPRTWHPKRQPVPYTITLETSYTNCEPTTAWGTNRWFARAGSIQGFVVDR
jgi:hypothetical protein